MTHPGHLLGCGEQRRVCELLLSSVRRGYELGAHRMARLLIGLVSVVISLVCGGAFYFAWMAVFLLTLELNRPILNVLLWPLAPVVTAVGFTVGVMIAQRLTGAERSGFAHIYRWPLVGCIVAVAAVYPIGPMLIVFGMLVAGTVSVALREVAAARGAGR